MEFRTLTVHDVRTIKLVWDKENNMYDIVLVGEHAWDMAYIHVWPVDKLADEPTPIAVEVAVEVVEPKSAPCEEDPGIQAAMEKDPKTGRFEW